MGQSRLAIFAPVLSKTRARSLEASEPDLKVHGGLVVKATKMWLESSQNNRVPAVCTCRQVSGWPPVKKPFGRPKGSSAITSGFALSSAWPTKEPARHESNGTRLNQDARRRAQCIVSSPV